MKMIHENYAPRFGYAPVPKVLLVFNGERHDFDEGVRMMKSQNPQADYFGFPGVIGISNMDDLQSLFGMKFSAVFKTDSCDFWVWAKCVELFVQPHIPPRIESQEEVEVGELVPCQFPEFHVQ